MLTRLLFTFIAIAIINGDNCTDPKLKEIIIKELGPKFVYPNGYLTVIQDLVGTGSIKQGIIPIKEVDQLGARYGFPDKFVEGLKLISLVDSQASQWFDMKTGKNDNYMQKEIGAAYPD